MTKRRDSNRMTDSLLLMITTIGALFMGTMAMIIRLKATKKPATVKKIILPPLFMSTGFLMFLYEPTIPTTIEVVFALLVGFGFSFLLIRTSKFEIKENKIYLKRSKAFIFILTGLLLLRVAFKIIIGDSISVEELGGMFFLLAYAMIIPWRVMMYRQFKEVEAQLKKQAKNPIVPVET